MLQLCGPGSRLCDGLSRREFLRVGGLGLAGLTLPTLLKARAAAPARRAKAVIQLFMWGGPSQLETFDLKPSAPDGIRGDFQPIATRVPGTRVCEHLPRLAQMADQYAILRSVTHTGVNHGTSAYHMLTGHIHFTPGTLRHPTPNDYPSVGCSASQFVRTPKELPAYVALPGVIVDGDGGEVPGQGPGFLGQRHAPFRAVGDPTEPGFSIDTLKLPGDIDAGRLRGRIDLGLQFLEDGFDALLAGQVDGLGERCCGHGGTPWGRNRGGFSGLRPGYHAAPEFPTQVPAAHPQLTDAQPVGGVA